MAALLPRLANRLVVLCYHSVQPDAAHTSVAPDQFADHLDWLADNCDVIGFRSIADARDTKRGRPTVSITFDDGYLDNYAIALPLLLERRMSATFFITTGLVDADPEVLHFVESLWGARTGEIKAMTWNQVAELAESGMDVGAHTLSHRRLLDLPEDQALEEIRGSKLAIEDHTRIPVRTFAYPFGKPRQHFDKSTTRLVRLAGIDAAGSILYRGVRPDDSPFAIPRIPITGDSTQMLAAKVHGKLDLVGLWQERAPRWAMQAVSVDVAAPK